MIAGKRVVPVDDDRSRDLAMAVGDAPFLPKLASADAPLQAPAGALHPARKSRRTSPPASRSAAPTVVADDGVRAFVARRGGRLYVWTVDHHCCGANRFTLLEAAVTRPARWRSLIEPIDAGGFEVCLDTGLHGSPRELVLDLTRRGRRIRASWNGCVFVT
jgi:hypothetical protein